MSKAHRFGIKTAAGADTPGFTATTNVGTPFRVSGGTHGGSFIVGDSTAGAAGTVVLEGSPNGSDASADWYPVLSFNGTPVAVSIAVASAAVATIPIAGEHAWLRARCSAFTSGVIPAWFVPRSRD